MKKAIILTLILFCLTACSGNDDLDSIFTDSTFPQQIPQVLSLDEIYQQVQNQMSIVHPNSLLRRIGFDLEHGNVDFDYIYITDNGEIFNRIIRIDSDGNYATAEYYIGLRNDDLTYDNDGIDYQDWSIDSDEAILLFTDYLDLSHIYYSSYETRIMFLEPGDSDDHHLTWRLLLGNVFSSGGCYQITIDAITGELIETRRD